MTTEEEALKAHEEAKASAWNIYLGKVASAWKAYEEVKASAWKAYEEAEASARKAYEEAKIMTESSGELIGIEKAHDSVCLAILLLPENSKDPSQIWEWRIGEKVKVKACAAV